MQNLDLKNVSCQVFANLVTYTYMGSANMYICMYVCMHILFIV